MKLYTKTGDDGTTGLFGGGRVPKASARVEAYGTVDETNAFIGVARATRLEPAIDAVLARVQEDLFTLGAELACVPGREGEARDGAHRRRGHRAARAGNRRGGRRLPAAQELRAARRVTPGGRTPRRSHGVPPGRARGALRSDDAPARGEVVIYLNRLSDLLFALARRANVIAGVPDVPWQPRG